jgi:chromosome segregation ATPase
MIPSKQQRDEWREQASSNGVMSCTLSEYVPSELFTLLDAVDELENRINGLERTLNEVGDAKSLVVAHLRGAENKVRELEAQIKHYEEVDYRDQELKVARKEAETARVDRYSTIQQKEEIYLKSRAEINRLKNIIVAQAEQIAALQKPVQ